jgi:hypothetical protein
MNEVGFDYASAVGELLTRMTCDDIAKALGYRSAGSIHDITKKGRIPSHVHGELLWALYHDTFGRKPPMSQGQSAGRMTVRNSA